jgi:hypothetical protein
MKLIAYLLFAILIMLGVIADHSWMRATGLTLDAGNGVGGQQPMTQTDTITIITILIAIVGAAVAIMSAVSARRNAKIAKEAKEQAKQAVLLKPRTEAIGHLHDAMAGIQKSKVINSGIKVSIQAAKKEAYLFSTVVGTGFDRALETAERLLRQRVDQRIDGLSQAPAIEAFLTDLEGLIQRMNNEAAL